MSVQQPITNTTSNGQEPLLPRALSTMTLHDPGTGNCNMHTCTSFHLNSSVSNLSTIFNKCIYSFVYVGDGKFILVTNSGHNILPTHFKPLDLNNVIVTLDILKKLIIVR